MILKLQSWVLFNSLFLYTCYDIIKIKSIFPDSENYIDKTNAIEDPSIIRIFKKLSPPSKHKNKLLVKRVVPHGAPSASSSLENVYDYNILYKPLFRIHTTKLIGNGVKDNTEEGILNNKLNYNDYNDLKEPKSEHFLIKEIDSTEQLLEPFQSNAYNKINLKVINDIHKTIKSMDLQSNKLKAYNNVIYVLKDILRASPFERSGEANSPAAAETPANEFEEAEQDKTKTQSWMPHYPPWNYWTYRKPIHQDVCPGMQVKVGNMCIWIPPH